jgi:hypothetical protein
MFLPGNKFGKGRPKISLNKPELLLPIIFQKSRINWAEDFCRLYKWYKTTLKPDAKAPGYLEYMSKRAQFEMYLELLPYLCTKIAVKDLDASKFVTEGDKQAMNDQTAALIKALENDSKPIENSKGNSLEGGNTSLPA